MIYSAVAMLLMVASATLSFYCVSAMTKAPATLLISQRRRRRLHVSQTPNHAGGHPHRAPPREYVQERLDGVGAAAARCGGVSIDRSWLKDLNVEHIVKWVYRMLVRIAFDALLI